MLFRWDPGPCPVCGVAHTACTAPNDQSMRVPILGSGVTIPVAPVVPPLQAERVQATLPAGQFTSATYRGKGPKKRP
jgi:hypothetical protein